MPIVEPQFVEAKWSAPAHVKALTTTRSGGVSDDVFAGLNVGDHVDDMPDNVAHNRTLLTNKLALTKPVQWLSQTHSTVIVEALADGQRREADACWTSEAGLACVVMTADCLPVFFTNAEGTKVAVAHAGWRGLVDGILEETLTVFPTLETVHCWLGPCIGPAAFEVGAEVMDAFVQKMPEAQSCFVAQKHAAGKYLADLYQLATLRLVAAGVPSAQVSSCGLCTFTDEARFFSYRRDGQTGRMASLIWIDK